MKIQIFYHIFLITNWYDIVKEQIDSLSNSKLLEVSTLNVGVLFDKQIDSEKEKLMELLSKVPSLNLMFIDENVSFGESKTLIKLKEFSMTDTNNTNILYHQYIEYDTTIQNKHSPLCFRFLHRDTVAIEIEWMNLSVLCRQYPRYQESDRLIMLERQPVLH